MEELSNNNLKAVIDKGELISCQFKGYELMHQKGSPGWGHTDTEMFPIIGPTAESAYRVQVPKGNAIQDQHGLLRELNYEMIQKSSQQAAYLKTYKAGTLIENSKYPERSTTKLLIWPYHFQLQKSYSLLENGLQISFAISGERDMPYMLGYHPAFKLNSPNARVETSNNIITITEIMEVGDKAFHLPNCNTLVLSDEKQIRITAEGFRDFMLWSPAMNMVCIEPITYYPYSKAQSLLHEGFDFLNTSERSFSFNLEVLQT